MREPMQLRGRVSLAVVVSCLASVLLSACVGGQRADMLLAGSDQAPPDSNVQVSRSAVASVRPVVIGEQRSVDDWLKVLPNGAIEATGSLCGATRVLVPGKRFLVGLVVSQDVSGVRIRHLVPLILDERTVGTTGGRPSQLPALLAADEADPHYVTVRFVLGRGLLFAQSVDFSGDPVTWSDDTGSPVEVYLESVDVDARRPSLPGKPWLLLDKAHFSWQLAGNATVAGDTAYPGRYAGLVQLQIPDKLGSAAIYHVPMVFCSDAQQLQDWQGRIVRTQETTVAVALSDSRLVAAK